jgi:hypothetical protein
VRKPARSIGGIATLMRHRRCRGRGMRGVAPRWGVGDSDVDTPLRSRVGGSGRRVLGISISTAQWSPVVDHHSASSLRASPKLIRSHHSTNVRWQACTLCVRIATSCVSTSYVRQTQMAPLRESGWMGDVGTISYRPSSSTRAEPQVPRCAAWPQGALHVRNRTLRMVW